MPNTESNKETTTKNKPGRPSNYRPEYCQELIEYFSSEPTKEVKTIFQGKNWTKEEVKIIPNKLPTFEGFAKKLGTYKDVLLRWKERHREFHTAWMRAKDYQQEALVQGAIQGVYDSKFSQFLACNITPFKAPALLNIEPGGINITLQKFTPSESLGEKVDIKPIKSKPILQIPEKIR
jgi:predicted transcriptional regulator